MLLLLDLNHELSTFGGTPNQLVMLDSTSSLFNTLCENHSVTD